MESTYEEMSNMTGKTYRTIRKKISGLEPIRKEGGRLYFDTTVALPMIYKDNRQKEGLDLQQERAKLAKEQRKKTRLQNEEIEGKLINAEEAKEEWTKYILNCRAKLLALPNKITPQVANQSSHSQIHNIIKKNVYDALNELAGQ